MTNQNTGIYSFPLSKRVWIFFIKLYWNILKPAAWINNKIRRSIMQVDFYRKAITFPLRNDDIFIITYPKSGTTWVQMILYQLTTDGDMEFRHISEKIPFLDRFADVGNKNASEEVSRRIYKTHMKYSLIPKGPGKYIYVLRDGRDVVVSYYYHYKSLFEFKSPFSTFFERFMKGKVQYGSWFQHVYHWYRNRKKLNVLYLSYEELKIDLEGTIKRIAQFCQLPLDEERLKRTVERSGFSFMKDHEEKFEHITEIMVENNLSYGKFIREGKTKYWPSYFTPTQERLYQKEYKKWIETKEKIKINNYTP